MFTLAERRMDVLCVQETVADVCLIGMLATPVDAVRKNKLTQVQVEQVMRDWLHTASDRNGGRRQRNSRLTEPARCVRPSHAAAAPTPPVPRAPDADVN